MQDHSSRAAPAVLGRLRKIDGDLNSRVVLVVPIQKRFAVESLGERPENGVLLREVLLLSCSCHSVLQGSGASDGAGRGSWWWRWH